MMIEKNKSLQAYNTFGIDVKAAAFISVESVEQLQAILQSKPEPVSILGGGSNLLLTKKVKGLLIQNAIKGIEVLREYKKTVYVSSGGGVVWNDLVNWCIAKGFGGIENLSLIPGTVGAAPIQNIGAYGVELTDVFHELEAVHLKTGKRKIFKHEDCHFGYRNSIFKNRLKGKYCICRVVLKLNKQPRLNLSYGAIQQTLTAMKVENPNIADVGKAVVVIRSSKLPDPAKLGNSGSFFKNPIIGKRQFNQLQKQFPQIVFYPQSDGKFKIPAGWLIEQCGWKGKRVGNTGSHAKQALVLVNYGDATGKEIWRLAQQIIKSVEKKYGILLKPEVNVW